MPELTENPTGGGSEKRRGGPPETLIPSGDANPNSNAGRAKAAARIRELEAEVKTLHERIAALEGREGLEVVPVTPELMQRVFGQRPEQDVGPTEQRLREWLVRDPKAFLADIRARERERSDQGDQEKELADLRREVGELRKVKGGRSDEGTARAVALIDKILAEG